MRKINKTIIWTMLLCIVLGAVIVLAGQWTLHKTSSTEF
ncbi:TPA: cytochrome C, partial [Citrobacter freundii]